MKYLSLLFLMIFLNACNPLDPDATGSYKGANFNPGLSSVTPTPAPAPVIKTLDGSWTPHYGDIALYQTFSGTLGSSIADTTVLNSVVGPSMVMNNAGAVYGTAPTASSVVMNGQALPLSGINEQMGFSNSHDFTVMSWVKFNSVSRWGRIASNGVSNWYNGFVIQVSPDLDCGHTYDGSFLFGIGAEVRVGNSDALLSDAAVYRTIGAYNDGLWHHIAMTVEQASNKKVIFYVDGVSVPIVKVDHYDSSSGCVNDISSGGTITGNVADFTGLTQASAGNAWNEAWFGSGRFAGGDFFDGQLSEPAIFKDAALSSSDISTIYLHQK